MRGFDFTALAQQFGSRDGLVQLAVIGAAVLLAWLFARVLRQRLPGSLEPGLRKIGAGSAHRLVFPLALLVLLWLAILTFGQLGGRTVLLRAALSLTLAFGAIRLTVYLLRHALAPSALLKASERFIVGGIWIMFAFYVTGIGDVIASELGDIVLTLGSKKVSLLLILEALLTVIVTVLVAFSVAGLIEKRLMRAEALDVSSRVVIGKFVRALLLVLSVLIALPLVGVDLTLLSVFGGALGVGLGLGLQKIASNYISGFIILLDRSIRLGDLVTIDNRQGIVEAIRSRYTVIRALDGTEAIVPNDAIITNTVVNHSYTDPKVSMRTLLSVGYDSDLDHVRKVVESLARAHPRVLADPPPSLMVKALGDNGIELELVTWLKDASQGQGSLRSDLLMEIVRAFRAEGISIPYPQHEVRMQASAGAGEVKKTASA
jgi:small-conductance mechanosensitive channel